MTIGWAIPVSASDDGAAAPSYARDMRVRPTTVLPGLLALAVAAVLLAPVAVMAQSGFASTITLHPPMASAGSAVEVAGIDFPGAQLVDLEVVTEGGTAVQLGTVMTAGRGNFRVLVPVPDDLPVGTWELRATALDGTRASLPFEVTASWSSLAEGAGSVADGATALADGASSTDGAAGVGADAADANEAGLTSRRGNSTTDIVVMIVFAVLLAAVGGGAAYAWREVHGLKLQPGMGYGDDPIWNGGGLDEITPELTASGEPGWRSRGEEP